MFFFVFDTNCRRKIENTNICFYQNYSIRLGFSFLAFKENATSPKSTAPTTTAPTMMTIGDTTASVSVEVNTTISEPVTTADNQGLIETMPVTNTTF